MNVIASIINRAVVGTISQRALLFISAKFMIPTAIKI